MFLKQSPRKNRPGGFSLLELMLTASLVPLVSFVIFTNISSGMRLWHALNQTVYEEDLNLFHQKVASDFNRMFKFSMIPFTGEPARVSFAASIEAPAALGGDRGIGRVSLFYDDSQKLLVKQEANLAEIAKDVPGRSQILMQHVSSFEVQYFSFDILQNDYGWVEDWDPSKKSLPSAIRLTFTLEGDRDPHVFTFPVPTGG